MSKALFICKIRLSYGNSYGLLNSASFVVNYLNSINIESKLVSVVDANNIDKVITEYDPFFVFIEALWVTPTKLMEIMSLKRHKNRVFIIRLHSRSTFIANEGIAFEWLLGYRNLRFRNLFVAPNNKEFSDDLKNTLGLQTAYLPNVYSPPKYDFAENDIKNEDIINLGCFGSIRPMKNHLTQAIASVRFAKILNKQLDFHINATRMEQHGDRVLNNIRNFFDGLDGKYQLVEHDWLSHEDFNKLIRRLDIGLQVSLSETFNIVAADFVYNDVPIIGSKSISWLPSRFQVEDPNSTDEIVEKLEYTWGFFGYWFKNSYKTALEKYNKEARKVWNNFVL
jgi:glycosyltransferase involved in cell wall biosynthesis